MKKDILVVDNDLDMQEILEEIFRDKPYNIHFYEETDDIFSLIALHHPDLILLDYNLNGINGGELCTKIKQESQTKHLPVILFSAYPRMIYSLEHYGYDSFIEKPFDIDELFHTIESFTANVSKETQ